VRHGFYQGRSQVACECAGPTARYVGQRGKRHVCIVLLFVCKHAFTMSARRKASSPPLPADAVHSSDSALVRARQQSRVRRLPELPLRHPRQTPAPVGVHNDACIRRFNSGGEASAVRKGCSTSLLGTASPKSPVLARNHCRDYH